MRRGFGIGVALVALWLAAAETGGAAIQADAPLAFEQDLERAVSVVGRTVSRVRVQSTRELPKEVADQFAQLEGKPLDLLLLGSTIRWFNETIRDTRLVVRAEKVASGVELVLVVDEKRKIASLEYIGNTIFDTGELSNLVSIEEGDDYEEEAVAGARRRILEFYRNAGFLQADVKVKVEGDKVTFAVNEGTVATIRSINISDITVVGAPREKNILRKSALDAFGIKVGDRLDRRAIKDGITRLKDWLRSRDFLIAKEPVVNSVVYDGGASANLDIVIVYGPRIKFGYRNNERFSYKELNAAVSEVQEVGIGSDYLDTVKSKITEMHHEVGLVNFKIETVVREDPAKGYRYVSFIFHEGGRVRIERLSLEGIYSMDKEKAAEMFLSFAPSLVRRYYFQDAGIRFAGELLAEHLRSLGYLSARLDVVKYKFNEKRDKVEIDLYFTEGVQTFVGEIKIAGAKVLTTEEIRSLLAVEAEKPFNVFAFERGVAQLKERYRNLGYLTMEIANEGKGQLVRYGMDNSTVDIHIDVREGPLIRVGDIIVRGNKQTHARVVTRELPFVKGDVLSRELQIEAEENLRKLNLFSSVILRPVERPGSPEIRDILILVEEGTPGLVEFGPGFRNDLGLRFFAGASYQNLGGWHRGVNAIGVVNRRLENFRFPEYRVSVGFREPYFLGWRVTLLTNVEVLRRIFSSFDATSNRVTTELRRELTKRITGLLQYSFERVKTFNAKVAGDNEKRLIGAVTPGIIYDSRDDVFNPTSGIFSVNRFELASEAFGSQSNVGYYRATSNNTAYVSLAPEVVWGFAVNFGFERSNLAGEAIPKIKLFRLGGTSTIRGYREEALEVDSQKSINGTLALVNYRSELNFPMEGSLGGALFWDAGNLFVDKVVPFNLRHSIGVGLRYRTPVGPVSLDFARKLGSPGRRNDDVNTEDLDTQRIHFSIGSF